MTLEIQEIETSIRNRVLSIETARAVKAGARSSEREPEGQLFHASVAFSPEEVSDCQVPEAVIDRKVADLIASAQVAMHPDYFAENPKGGFHYTGSHAHGGFRLMFFEWWPV